jgi:hypothetical protein
MNETKVDKVNEKKRGKPEKFTVKQVIDVLRQCAGVMLPAAEKLKVSRTTIWNYCQRHPEIKAALAEIDESMIDLAESHLLINAKQGKQWAVERILRTKGRKRGYGEGVEISGPAGGAVEVNSVVEVRFVKATPRQED